MTEQKLIVQKQSVGQTTLPKDPQRSKQDTQPPVMQKESFKILRNALIIADDAFSILENSESEMDSASPNAKANSLLRTVKHLSGINEYSR